MKRAVVFLNGRSSNGKVIMVKDSLSAVIDEANRRFGVNGQVLLTSKGGQIEDLELIRDDEVLYLSCGEDFIKPCSLQGTSNEWIVLNIGGKKFATTKSTLLTKEPGSMLSRMISKDWNFTNHRDESGAFLIDRSPTYFEPLLNYLRHGEIIIDCGVNMKGVLEEAKFYGFEGAISQLQAMIQKSEVSGDKPLSRSDVISVLIHVSPKVELRFQGVNLSGADLSKLDLSRINFKYACMKQCNLSGANLSWCCLERADLSQAILDGAQLLGVKMLCANLEEASLIGCNFDDPSGDTARLEGVNLKNANLEGSNMAGINLRVSTLKNAKLENCDLREAVLAGADLEHCSLSGSDLNNANLRGANLLHTVFDFMMTPLHMSQTIR